MAGSCWARAFGHGRRVSLSARAPHSDASLRPRALLSDEDCLIVFRWRARWLNRKRGRTVVEPDVVPSPARVRARAQDEEVPGLSEGVRPTGEVRAPRERRRLLLPG